MSLIPGAVDNVGGNAIPHPPNAAAIGSLTHGAGLPAA